MGSGFVQHFCAEKRSELKEKNPEASFAELSKLQAAAWKDLPEEDKSVYVAMHQVNLPIWLCCLCTNV